MSSRAGGVLCTAISIVAAALGCGSPSPDAAGTTTIEGPVASSGGPAVDGMEHGSETTAMASSSDDSAVASSSGPGGPACVNQGGGGSPPERVLFVVDASASMLDPVTGNGGPPVVPWEEMLLVLEQYTSCLGDDAQARARFGLRLMPGPVGDDVCGRSDALDIDGWVSKDELIARAAEVVPQGGRAMRRSLEELPVDADLIVMLTHGAPGCGDDSDPEVFDPEVGDVVSAQGASVTIGHIALQEGITPQTIDGEPDGVDAWQELYELGLQIETTCVYKLALFGALDACPSLIECLYGNRIDPCVFLFNPPESGDPDEVEVRIGDDEEPIPRIDECGVDPGPGWEFGGAWFGGNDWFLMVCPYEICQRSWDEGVHIQHSCER